jgi:hypothetical protein
MQTPKVLEDLVRWPASLESFDLEYTFGACYSRKGLSIEWSLNTLQPILAIHRTTLLSISIRCINFGGLTGFDVRDFPNLQELRLSDATTSPRYRNYTTDAHLIPNLLAPRLRVFHWDLTLEDQQCSESLGYFSQEEEDFLRAVAHEAIKVKCPLRMLRITYTPYTWLESDIQYPWDRMDTLNRELQVAGIQVCYNPPTISHEEFSTQLRRVREEAKRSSNTEGPRHDSITVP